MTNKYARFALLIALGTSGGYGQDRTSAITGTVTDQSGLPVPEVRIEVLNGGTNELRRTVTAADGTYRLARLPVGVYSVTAEKQGLRKSRHEGVVVEVDRDVVADHRLQAGERSDSVVVIGEAHSVEASPSAITSVVDARTIDQLPLNGRDYVQLATLQAGVTAVRAQSRSVDIGFGTHLSISGSRPFQNSFRLDGLNLTTYNGSTPGSINGVNLGVDAIAEFSVHSSTYGAQYGQAGGGIVNAVTRSGSNELHGTAFFFHRNDNLDARNFFDPERVPEFRRHQFGGSVGGPIKRNKTFVFGNYESMREARGNTTVNTTLSAEARSGRLTTGTVPVDPGIARILSFYPLPNGAVFGNTGFFVFTNNTLSNQHFATTRVDHNATENDKLFFRYTFDDGSQSSDTDFAAAVRNSRTRSQSAVIEETHIVSPRLLNTARAGFLRNMTRDGDSVTRIPATDTAALEFVPGAGIMGSVIVIGMTDFPGGSGSLGVNKPILNSWQFSDDMNYISGRHSVKWGARFERTQFNIDSQNRQFGDYRFRDVERLLRNAPERFRAQFPGSDTIRGFRQTIGGLYIQDAWKISARVVLEAGVRWEWATVPAEVNGKIANLDKLTDTKMRVGGPLYDNPSWKNIAPRLGLAWDVAGNGRTIIRAGYGVFPDLLLSPYVSYIGVRNPPFFQRGETRALVAGDFPKGGYNALLRNPTVDLAVERIPRDLRQPYVQQWNFNVERLLGSGESVRLAYVGSHGLNLSSITNDANVVQPVTAADGRLFFPANGTAINPVFGGIRNRAFDAHSFYHGLQTTYRRRLARGLQTQVAYSYSKSIDDSSNFYNSAESPNRGLLPVSGFPKMNRGLSGHDQRHSFSLNGTWTPPLREGPGWRRIFGGWQIGGIVTATSGLPTTAWMGYDSARTKSHLAASSLGQRPDLAPGGSNSPVTGDPQRWVEISAFRRPEPGYLGNLGRNTIKGPGLANVDYSMVKRFRLPLLGDKGTLDLRFEFFNLLNRTNFDLPAVERMETFTSDTAAREDFGRITSAGESREIQLGLKVRF